MVYRNYTTSSDKHIATVTQLIKNGWSQARLRNRTVAHCAYLWFASLNNQDSHNDALQHRNNALQRKKVYGPILHYSRQGFIELVHTWNTLRGRNDTKLNLPMSADVENKIPMPTKRYRKETSVYDIERVLTVYISRLDFTTRTTSKKYHQTKTRQGCDKKKVSFDILLRIMRRA